MIVEESKQWEIDGGGLNISGKYVSEMLQHYAWAKNKCSDFVGRDELIQECMKVIAKPNRQGNKKKYDFSGISSAVVGVSGAGKTALMAKLAHLSYEKRTNNTPVLIRFCGTSRGSSSGFELMKRH